MIKEKRFRREVTHFYRDMTVKYHRYLLVTINTLGDLYKSRITYGEHKYDGKIVFTKRHITRF